MPRHAEWWPRAQMMLRAGATYAEVAREVGRTPDAVYRTAKRRGLAKPRRGAAWWPEAERMLRGGASVTAVAAAVGVSRQTVYQTAKRRGWRVGKQTTLTPSEEPAARC